MRSMTPCQSTACCEEIDALFNTVSETIRKPLIVKAKIALGKQK